MRNRFYSGIFVTCRGTATVLVVAALLTLDGSMTVGTATAGVLAVNAVFGAPTAHGDPRRGPLLPSGVQPRDRIGVDI